jgi:hypothetical protein
MKMILLLLSGCLLAGVARADVNLSIAKEQAKRAAGTESAPPAARPPSAPPPSTNPALAATLQNVTDLRGDFAAISAAADVTAAAEQRVALLNHLAAAAQGNKASSANLRKLADDLIAALAGQKKVSPETVKLARVVHALFNGAHLTAAQQEILLNDAKKSFTVADVSDDAAAKVLEDLKTIAAETK